jgi:bifunctional non-homologous end joining protein LigD
MRDVFRLSSTGASRSGRATKLARPVQPGASWRSLRRCCRFAFGQDLTLPKSPLLRFGASSPSVSIQHYRSGRQSDWLKSLCLISDPSVIIGYVTKAVSGIVGLPVLGFYEGVSLIHAGRVGTGVSQTEAQALWQGLRTIQTKDGPISQRLTATRA